jgi:hypothetical protein
MSESAGGARVTCGLVRSFVLFFLSAALVASQASDKRGALDPAFEKIPFDQWLGERGQPHLRWTAKATRAELSFHQRLVVRVEIAVDGRDLETRRGNGELMMFVQITDGDGTRYQNHHSVELNKLTENVKAANLDSSFQAFILPGDYRLAAAIQDTATGEHSTIQAKFRVAPPQEDLLRDAWRHLPPVEFIGKEESPDSWYLPAILGRLEWAAAVHSPARLNIILNVASSVPAPGSRPSPSGEMAALLPTLKAFSETGSSSVSEHVEVLDLARRRAAFHQDEVNSLDWPGLKASLGEANTASIDVHSLSERHHDAQFFVSEVRRLLRASDKPCVLVVLTKPVAFESGEDLEPVSLEALPACRVIYIRYSAPTERVRPFDPRMGGRGRGGRMGGPMSRGQISPSALDQLEATLKPLNPKVFDVGSPEQMTKSLVEIERALLTLGGQSTR